MTTIYLRYLAESRHVLSTLPLVSHSLARYKHHHIVETNSSGIRLPWTNMAVFVPAVLTALAASSLVSANMGASIFNTRATCSGSVESCSTGADSASACCVNKPGGQFLQTQFWDTDPGEYCCTTGRLLLASLTVAEPQSLARQIRGPSTGCGQITATVPMIRAAILAEHTPI